MKAIRFIPEKLELNLVRAEIPRVPVGDQVVIKIAYSGVCGTDLHISQGEYPVRSYGLILGHEFSGIAQAVGPNVKHIKLGDKVAVDPNSPCHVCEHCTTGNYNRCHGGVVKTNIGTYQDGGWAEYCIVPASQVFKVPDEITLEQAALTEPLSCLAHGWDKVSPIPVGATILIQGAGIIGNLWAAALHLQGHKKVTMSEPLETRRKLFEKLGTSYNCVDPKELIDFQADLVIDCSGAPAAIEKAVDLLAPGGKLCIFGVAPPQGQSSFSPYKMFLKELTITAVKLNPYCFPKALGLIEAMGDTYLHFDKLGVKVYRLEEYKQALADLKAGSIAKAMFKIGK